MSKTEKRTQILSTIIDSIKKPPETTTFPFTPLKLPEGFRGAIIMTDADLCTGCGNCVRYCPANALELQRKSREEFRLIYYPARCAYCGQCEESCRNDAISQTNELVKPTRDPDTLVIILKDSNSNNI